MIDRGGTTTESEQPFIDTLRRLMADFRSPFVPDFPRFTGGAVGYLGYGAASWFEPVLGDLGEGGDGADQAGFMLFDTVLAFDHVQHRPHGALGVIWIPLSGPKLGQDRVSHELVHLTVVAVNDFDHAGEIAVQEFDQLLRLHPLG